jgi:N-acetylmuramoyl-L-alanine amidase
MITLAWYLLKVIICSGILCGYYYAALRNKIFHRWNRFYLLASIVLALVVPLMKINIFQTQGTQKGTVVRMLQTINSGDEIIIEYSRNNGLHLSSENIIGGSYMLISMVLLVIFFLALHKISRLKKKYPGTKLNGISFISTDAKGTPFSFFNSIFWNNAIDLNSKQGHEIFNHEIAHIKERHSYDKIFMNVVLLFFWVNPFFWLMQKELSMIHEFIADKEALDENDIDAFAQMILQTVYPGQHFSITNNFFNSPLKRRLTMFTKNKNLKVNYASRLLVLPLAAIVFFAFTVKMKTIKNSNHYSGKKITVVIDAGHGGSDNGVIENNIKEKDLNLAIAKGILALNKNENLHIILSRSGDELFTPQDRVKFAEANKADLFVSIHMDAEENEDKNKHSGLTIFIPKNDNAYLSESKLLGSAIVESFRNKYQLQVNDYLQQREQGIYVLKANQYPSVLIEAGFITTQTDFDYLTKPGNQEIIAENILNGISQYAEQNLINKNGSTSLNVDTPHSKSALKSTISAQIDEKVKDVTNNSIIENTISSTPKPLYIVDGKETASPKIKDLPADKIESIVIWKDDPAVKKYGDKAKNGVVEITTKKEKIILEDGSPKSILNSNGYNDTIPAKLFTKVENEAEFPGGKDAWLKYILSQVEKNQRKFTEKDFGTCLVRFIVNTDGHVSKVEATTMTDSHLAKIAVDAILAGPKWIPATQNNQVVASYRLQPVTLSMPK